MGLGKIELNLAGAFNHFTYTYPDEALFKVGWRENAKPARGA